MKEFILNFYNKFLKSSQSSSLFLIIVFIIIFFSIFTKVLLPLFLAFIIIYIILGPFNYLQTKIGKKPAIIVILLILYLLFFGVFSWIFPIIWSQINDLFIKFSNIDKSFIDKIKQFDYQSYFSEYIIDVSSIVENLTVQLQSYVSQSAKVLVSFSFNSLNRIFISSINFILITLVIYFFLNDKNLISKWLTENVLPKKNDKIINFLENLDLQMQRYLRGKLLEILIIFGICLIVFWFFNLNYAELLAVLVGVSVIIPYVGATLVTLPVFLVAVYQWGFSSQTYWLMLAYFLIQIFDGNILFTILFSKAISVHPIVIVAATIFFGGIWGISGMFFSVPLVILLKNIYYYWPTLEKNQKEK